MLAAPYRGGWAPVKANRGVQNPGRQPASQAAAAKGLPCWGEGDHNHPLPTQNGGSARPMLKLPHKGTAQWAHGSTAPYWGGGGAPVEAPPGVTELAELGTDGWRAPGRVHGQASSEVT